MHSIWLDTKYLGMLSFRLDRFKKTDDNLYNFRCPFCGDSGKNKFKSRGYIYQHEGQLKFKCHNCGQSKHFSTFLKEFDSTIYSDYIFEVLKEKRENSGIKGFYSRNDRVTSIVVQKPQFDPLKSLKSLNSFDANHPLIEYVTNRKIPKELYYKLYYVTRFMEWINTLLPNKFDANQLKRDEPRLIIPFFDEDGSVFAVTGRSFKSSSIKYITIKFDETKNKIYGMNEVNPESRVYIVEGPIDSFFLDNCIAFAGSSGSIPKFKDSVIVLDNEPRNKDIGRLNEKFLDSGYNVCIWPSSIIHKDINDLVVHGYSKQQIKEIIDDNTYSGLRGKLELAKWRVVK